MTSSADGAAGHDRSRGGMRLLIGWLLVMLAWAAGSGRGRRQLNVLGLFDMDSARCRRACSRAPHEGRSDLAAVQLAVQHVNRRRVVPGYRLRLITNNTQVRLPVTDRSGCRGH